MTPVMIRMMQKPRIAHGSRPIGNVGAIVPIRAIWPLIVGDGGIQGCLKWRPHGAAERIAVHLVGLKGLQWGYLAKHRINLWQVLGGEARSRLKVTTGTPFQPISLILGVATMKSRRAERQVFVNAIGHAGFGGHGKQNVFCRMGLSVGLDRCAIVCGGQNTIWRLAAQHVLCGLWSAARVGGRRTVCAVSG